MIKQEIRELCKMEHHNGYKGTLYSDGTMDLYNKEGKKIYMAGSNKICSPDEPYRALEMLPQIMREIKRENDKEFEKL